MYNRNILLFSTSPSDDFSLLCIFEFLMNFFRLCGKVEPPPYPQVHLCLEAFMIFCYYRQPLLSNQLAQSNFFIITFSTFRFINEAL